MKFQFFLFLFFLNLSITSHSQIIKSPEKFRSLGIDIYGEYKSYQIYYDSTTQLNYFGDTITQNFKPINFHPRQDRFKKNYFRYGFLLCKRGDMKGLLDLDGNKILDLCHFIRFNTRDSLISAYVCDGGEWVYLNFEGDTLSHGHGRRGNYVPKIEYPLNKAETQMVDGKIGRKGITFFGYLNDKANWEIPPRFHGAHDFESNYAKVKLNDLWGIINSEGKWVVAPSIESDDFEILKVLEEKGKN